MNKYERPYIKPIQPGMPSKTGNAPCVETVSDIEGIPVERIANEYGSPVFIVSEKKIRKNIQKANKIFANEYPDVQFAWSYKTNYLNEVCKIMHEEGSLAEVVSGFEYEKAIRNGVPGDKIIFNGPDKTEQDLRESIKQKSYLHIDNFDELFAIEKIANELKTEAKVAIRVNMKSGAGSEWTKFGFNLESGQAEEAAKKISENQYMHLYGLHTHVGTFVDRAEIYRTATKKLCKLAIDIRNKYGIRVQYIDMGGGFVSPNTLKAVYTSAQDSKPTLMDYAEAISEELYEAPFEEKYRPKLILESGRALIDDTSLLLTTVTANKRSATGRRYTIIDAGVNTLFTAFWYNHKVTPTTQHSPYWEDTTLYGPLCMNIDVIRESVILPLLNKGEHLLIHNVGAYNMTQGMQFINLRPAVVLIKNNGELKTIRRKEEPDDLERLEKE